LKKKADSFLPASHLSSSLEKTAKIVRGFYEVILRTTLRAEEDNLRREKGQVKMTNLTP